MIFFLFFPFFLYDHVFYSTRLFSRDVNVQLLHQHLGDRPDGSETFDFPFFVAFADYHPSCLHGFFVLVS